MIRLLVAVAWIYVVLMMAVAEATNTNGSVLGGLVTFLLYGLGPLALLLYILGTPARKKALRAREAQAQRQSTTAMPSQAADSSAPSDPPDARRHAAADAIAPMREEP